MVERLRGRAGQRQRRRRLDAEPTCRLCRAKGIIVPSVVPDHIVALTNGGTDNDGNIQCLCQACHEAKTAIDLGRRARPTIGLDGWPIP